MIFFAPFSERLNWSLKENLYFLLPFSQENRECEGQQQIRATRADGDSACLAQGDFRNGDACCQSVEAALPAEWVSPHEL